MTVTFINKPAGQFAALTAKVSDAAPMPPVISAGTLRNDLLPGFSVGMVPLSTLVPAHHPVRKPSQRQVARVARSIRRFGFRNPVMLGKDCEIIDGHIRVEAARRLGLKEIPCITVEDLSNADISLLRITQNRLQERGDWDEQALKIEFAFLLEFEPDLTVTGFDAPEIDRLLVLDDLGLDEADPLDKLGDLPDPDAAAVTRPGDLWHLGAHRVLCGNARSSDDIALAIGDRELSAVFTDHPFNLSVKKDISVGSGKFAEFAEASGEMTDAKYEDFLTITTGNMAKALKPGGILFLCIDWRHAEVLMRVLRTLGLQLINQCVWGKDKAGMGSLYRSQYELVLVAIVSFSTGLQRPSERYWSCADAVVVGPLRPDCRALLGTGRDHPP